ncbi:hypothetical protein [Marinobacterium sedimentorum]|uniref:hypothetical protein n=1 Tax=Marinobacterium sedimentorum TaxID=2927804 RepID=UPI0020C5F62B|nr:hypothetical protein [Marinobacterium sedimentorum]MCP8686067.1 hypothetical protein [Marinobacterium sedimentorum]
MSKQHLPRYNGNFELDQKGKTFVMPSGELSSFDDLVILDTSIDTVRQLYKGTPDEALLNDLSERLEDSPGKAQYHWFGRPWLLRRGGKSGFAYLLQNVSDGLVVLIKNNHIKADQEGSHVKIELSPKVIRDQYPESLQIMMDDIAREACTDEPTPNGCAIHLACDLQGWTPPANLAESLTCRSHKVYDRNGFSDLSVTTGEVAAIYGRGQSYTFGSASSLQFAIYNKSKEIYAHDKADFFLPIWREKVAEDLTTKLYNEDAPVWRCEARFSHTVINQFADYNQVNLKSFEAVTAYLGNIWRYALQNFRLDCSRDYVHPLWTLLEQDAEFYPPSPSFTEKRMYKRPGIGNEKNVALALGNLLSIYARNNISARQAWKCLKKSGMWADLMGYCKQRKVSKDELFEVIEQGLKERRLASKVAA